MNILIIGCGLVGSALAGEFDKIGHDVSVVERNDDAFDRLPADFGGFTTTGVAIDQEVLKRAGITTCDALYAVTDDDDMNIMVSQLAKQVFNIPKIYARVNNIAKGEVFEKLGINVICPVKLTVSAACAAIEEDDGEGKELNFGSHTVHFSTLEVPDELVGSKPDEIELEGSEVLFGILRESMLILYRGQQTPLEAGDKLIFANK